MADTANYAIRLTAHTKPSRIGHNYTKNHHETPSPSPNFQNGAPPRRKFEFPALPKGVLRSAMTSGLNHRFQSSHQLHNAIIAHRHHLMTTKPIYSGLPSPARYALRPVPLRDRKKKHRTIIRIGFIYVVNICFYIVMCSKGLSDIVGLADFQILLHIWCRVCCWLSVVPFVVCVFVIRCYFVKWRNCL